MEFHEDPLNIVCQRHYPGILLTGDYEITDCMVCHAKIQVSNMVLDAATAYTQNDREIVLVCAECDRRVSRALTAAPIVQTQNSGHSNWYVPPSQHTWSNWERLDDIVKAFLPAT